MFHANGNNKIVGVAIHISDKIVFKTKGITKDKEGHYRMIKGSIQETLSSLTYMRSIQENLNIQSKYQQT